MYSCIHPLAHCAPLERPSGVGRKAYRHLGPLEPELDTKATGKEFPCIN
jgi:hypothetical protein